MILAIDPGPLQSGWCLFGERVIDSGIMDNDPLLRKVIGSGADHLAIEMIASYGMAVGKDVFETCVWIGRFIQAWRDPESVKLVYRKDIKLELCGSARAKDTNVRQSLIDRVGPQGTKKVPGPTYGIKSHAWSALAVALVAKG